MKATHGSRASERPSRVGSRASVNGRPRVTGPVNLLKPHYVPDRLLCAYSSTPTFLTGPRLDACLRA